MINELITYQKILKEANITGKPLEELKSCLLILYATENSKPNSFKANKFLFILTCTEAIAPTILKLIEIFLKMFPKTFESIQSTIKATRLAYFDLNITVMLSQTH